MLRPINPFATIASLIFAREAALQLFLVGLLLNQNCGESFKEMISELQGAIKNVASSKISSFLYIDAYYELNRLTQPSSLEGILTDFIEQEIIKKQDDGTYTITNLGALLLAKDLSAFPNLRKRPLRILRFEGNGNFNILDDKTFNEGYAISFNAPKTT